jgi:hypothetical protein
MVVEEDVLRHIADNEAWKDFNKEFPWFAKDPRSLNLVLPLMDSIHVGI